MLFFGCDDTAKSEFLGMRGAKGNLAGPGQSQSNLWFVKEDKLDCFGTPIGRGAVWMNDPVKAGTASDPFLFDQFDKRSVHLGHNRGKDVMFVFEVDATGDGDWKKLCEVVVPASGYCWREFSEQERGAWVRIKTDSDLTNAFAVFNYSNRDGRSTGCSPIFAGIAKLDDCSYGGGVIRARGHDRGTLQFAASTVCDGQVLEDGYYELDVDMKLRPVDDPQAFRVDEKKLFSAGERCNCR